MMALPDDGPAHPSSRAAGKEPGRPTQSVEAENRSISLRRAVAVDWIWLAVFAALPVAGLLSGPAYAPLLFFAAATSSLCALIGKNRRLRIDRALAVFAAGFTVLCWCSTAWSIVPGRSLSAAAQTTAVLTGSLLICATQQAFPRPLLRPLIRILIVSFPVGAAILVGDSIFGYPLQNAIGHAATKYNRGIDHYLLLLLPLLGYQVAQRRWTMVALLTVSGLLTVVIGVNTTAKIATVLSALVLGMALLLPRLTDWLLRAATCAWVLGLPVFLSLLGSNRSMFFPYLKASMLHRFEIWDYMSARIFERPILGWGLQSAASVPIHSDELAGYKWVSASGIYPHNQILQLWIETGAVGALLGLAFLATVLCSIRKKMSPPMRPFALSAFVFAVCVASTGYQIYTDSWWAALAASAFLFSLFDRMITPNVPEAGPLDKTEESGNGQPEEGLRRRADRSDGMRQRSDGSSD